MSDCIFDKIIKKQIPADIVYENEKVLAFKDISPIAPVHVLVIPKTKRKDLNEISNYPTEVSDLFIEAVKVAKKLGLDQKGYRIISNCGADGGQSVEYIHIHILGGKTLGWDQL